MGNKDKDKNQGDSAASEGAMGGLTNSWDACHTNRDLSQEKEAMDATLAKQVAEAIAREMAKAHTHYQVLLNDRGAALGFKVMDPFDRTKDKAIYRGWQMWSERLDMPLMQWKVIQKRLKFHISTT